MATLITKNSSTASSVPTAAQLVQGELAVNVTDKRLFTENSSGTVVELGTNPSTLALPNGTANGVAYLNGSKVLTTGSALTFDGTTFGIGVNTLFDNAKELRWKNASGVARPVLQIYSDNNLYLDSEDGAQIYRTAGTERMRLTSTGLGIGTSSPSYKLSVNSGASTTIGLFTSTGSSAYLGLANSGATTYIGNDSTSGSFIIQTPSSGFSTKLTLDNPGNLGLGVTPSAWDSSYKAVRVNNFTLASQDQTGGGELSKNSYVASGGANTYIANGFATKYEQTAGTHKWFTAASGTAGNAITFTQAMTLDASGNLGVGTTNPSSFGLLAVFKGQTADTAIVVGNDGTSNTATTMSFALSESGAKQGWFRRYRDGTGNTEIGFSDALLFTGNVTGTKAERARITSGGDVGIGTTSPAVRLHVDSSGGGIVRVTRLASSAGAYGQLEHDGTNTTLTSSAATIFNAGGATERARITSGGDVGIGTTSPSTRLQVTSASPTIRIEESGAGAKRLDLSVNSSAEARIAAPQSGSVLIFDTVGSERARITSGGYFKASNNGSYDNSAGLYHELDSDQDNHAVYIKATNASLSTTGVVQLGVSRNTTNNSFYALSYYNSGAAAYKFRVADSGNVTNTNGTYGTISDAKMKTDIVDASSQWADIKAVRFRKFKMKDDPTGLVQLGVVAQELEQTSPGLVEEHADKDAEGNDLGTTTKSVKTSVLLMKAAVALQEAMTRIEQLEAKVAALESNP